MANAQKTTRIKVETVHTEEDVVVLELNKDEAETLLFIMHRVGGSPEDTRRKYTQEVLRSLVGAGVEYIHHIPTTLQRAIYFSPEEGITK